MPVVAGLDTDHPRAARRLAIARTGGGYFLAPPVGASGDVFGG
jgi:hypothetical protein